MKTRFAQFVYTINRIDRRHLQFAYFVLMFAVGVIMQRPSDGGSDPI
jgi:hypothetical protein